MYSQFSAKDLYEVSFKTTNNIEINGQNFERDEVVLFFENLQIANIAPDITTHEASGGKNNFSWMMWDGVRAVDFIFEEGMLNFYSLQFLTQSRFGDSGAYNVSIPVRESNLISNGSGIVNLEYTPDTSRSMFVYKTTGGVITEKITPVGISGKEVDLGSSNANAAILIDYYFQNDQVKYCEIGGENLKGFFKMTSKINIVDEKDGARTTLLFVMPKVKIMSGFNMTFGVRANPIVSALRIRAFPDDSGKTIARFINLNQDIEG